MTDLDALNDLVESFVFGVDLTTRDRHQWERDENDNFVEYDASGYCTNRRCARCGECWFACCTLDEPIGCRHKARKYTTSEYPALELFHRAVLEGRVPSFHGRHDPVGGENYHCTMYDNAGRRITETAAKLPLAITMTYLRAVGAPLP